MQCHWRLPQAFFLLCLCVSCGLLTGLFAQAQNNADSQKSDSSSSWTASGGQQGLSGNANPTRSRQSHSENGGRSVDTQSIETLGPDGRYVPYLDVERESVKVDANTVRTVERTFARDPDGHQTLQQVKQIDQRSLGDGRQKVVRTTSNPDLNGGLQIVNREIQESRPTGPKQRETKTTVLTPDVNGGLTPVMMMEQHETQGSGQTQYRKSTLLPDGNGGWQVSEVREGTTKEEGKDRTTEERVLRPDTEGKLILSERNVTRNQQDAGGDGRETSESYSTSLPGTSEDGSLHLNQRIVKVRRARLDAGQRSDEQTAQRNPGAPGDSPRITLTAIDIVRPTSSGIATERTVKALSEDGSQGVVWVDTQKNSNTPAVQVDGAPAKPR